MVAERIKILIVEDEPSLSTTLVRATETYFSPLCVGSKAAAMGVVEDGTEVAAAIVDVGLPDGDGLEVVARLRARFADLPILVLTGSMEPATINRAQLLHAEYVVKPFFTDNVAKFIQRALQRSSSVDKERLQGVVAQITREQRLSAREAQILIFAVEGVPRRHIADVLGVSENTVKSQVRSLLEKVGKQTLSEAVWWVRSLVDGPTQAN
ncbi:MAG: response regulator transcription factor [Kofleriaceae bacterium]|nr:response regulator transcription factor [Myxococcales bacterium]MCB9572954.1 response regulator transcription factor [Kofleriaceae bacterium]